MRKLLSRGIRAHTPKNLSKQSFGLGWMHCKTAHQKSFIDSSWKSDQFGEAPECVSRLYVWYSTAQHIITRPSMLLCIHRIQFSIFISFTIPAFHFILEWKYGISSECIQYQRRECVRTHERRTEECHLINKYMLSSIAILRYRVCCVWAHILTYTCTLTLYMFTLLLAGSTTTTT